MKTKTFVLVAVAVFAALVGGVMYVALSGGGEDRRVGALSTTGTPLNVDWRITIPGVTGVLNAKALLGGPHEILSASLGGEAPASAVGARTGKVAFTPASFVQPLGKQSLELFSQAATGKLWPKVTLEAWTRGATPALFMRYELGTASPTQSDEGGNTDDSLSHSAAVGYQTVAVTAGPAAAPAQAGSGRLVIPGVADATNPMEINSYSWGWTLPAVTSSTGLTTGKLNVKDVTVKRTLDSHTPWLWQNLATGKLIPEVRLEVQKPTQPAPYLVYTLRNVIVSSVSDGGASGQAGEQSVKLSFSKIEIESKEITPKGTFGPATKVGYDLAAALKY